MAECGPWRQSLKDSHELRLLIAHEVLYGRGLRQPAFQRPSKALASQSARSLSQLGGEDAQGSETGGRDVGTAPSAMAAAADADVTDAAEGRELARKLPRYARVNTLKASVEAVVKALQQEGWRLTQAPADVGGGSSTGATALAARPSARKLSALAGASAPVPG